MSDQRTLRVGVIGRGFGARVVAPMYASMENCEVVDCVSPRDDQAITALCQRSDLDLVSVHSPPFLHLDHVRRAVEAGHAVLCDKPFGRNGAEAQEMVDLATAAGVLNLVNYEFRVHPIRAALRAKLDEGVVGKVEHVQWTSFAALWGPGTRRYGWVFDASLGGGWVRVMGAHCLDFLRWTFGEFVEATAELRTSVPERPDAEGKMHTCTGEDGFTANLRTDRGVSVVLDATATGGVDRPTRVVVVGSNGVLEVLSESVHEIGGRIVLHTSHGTSDLMRLEPWADPTKHDDSAMRSWTKLILDAVRSGAPDPVMSTFADGLANAVAMEKLTAPH